MKYLKLILVILPISLIIASACSNNTTSSKNEKEDISISKDESQNIDSIVDAIDRMRAKIESQSIAPIEINTDNLRAKIKQKWQSIHFYVVNEVVIKIKTYPYKEISERTEEFYANELGLKLVVIEDSGAGEKGKPISEIDKMYYFDNESVIFERSKQVEKEYSLRTSDAEELFSEFNEYLDILRDYNNQ